MILSSIHAREILDSRGIPTIETRITLADGSTATGAVPSGASTGTSEAVELRDGDPKRYFGQGVLKAVENVNTTISQAVLNKDFATQSDFDKTLNQLDGTPNKAKLGGNAILSCSMAFCKASALSKKIPLYKYFQELTGSTTIEIPQLNILILEGGKHGDWATDFQEYMVVPKREKFPSVKESLRVGAEIFKATHDILLEKKYSATVGFEGAFAPREIRSNTEAFDIMVDAIEKAGYKPGDEVMLGLDAAASEFFENGKYNLKRENKSLTPEDWSKLQIEWYTDYPFWSLEDVFDQEDWQTWTNFTSAFGKDHLIIGDDLLTTNTQRIQIAIDMKASNAAIIKINQIGTITETLDAIKLCDSAGIITMISHRGGETNDDLIADLVMGTSSWQTKFGGPDRGERLAKYNRLLEIEEDLTK